MGISGGASESTAIANQLCSESIQGIRTVRAFNIEPQIMGLYETLISEGQSAKKKAFTAAIGTGSSNLLMFSLYWLAFFYGGWLIKGVGAAGGDIMKCFMAMMMAGFGIAMAGMTTPDIGKCKAAADAIFPVIKRTSKIDASEDGPTASTAPPAFDGGLALTALDFAYPSRLDRPILKSVDLRIEAGQTTALVGPSGSGKSTIVSLIQRFYDPTGGKLTLGPSGVELSSVPLAWWRTQIGFVGQEPVLFKGTIAENIR